MSTYLLKDGRTISAGTLVDFDATHTNSVGALTVDEFQAFVAQVIADPPPPAPPPITSVTPRQARLALSAAGLLDKVNAAVAASDQATQITWEFASLIERGDPLMTSLGNALGLSGDQIDALFKQAATL